MDDDKLIEEAGRMAAERGLSAAVCPYTFINSPFWKARDYAGFEREGRSNLNAWMKGWIEKRKEMNPPKATRTSTAGGKR